MEVRENRTKPPPPPKATDTPLKRRMERRALWMCGGEEEEEGYEMGQVAERISRTRDRAPEHSSRHQMLINTMPFIDTLQKLKKTFWEQKDPQNTGLCHEELLGLY
ncbi:unnamed protein product [Nippostrongylus brasiliensis]|uniref:EF-hand domain-containing protein n=1 Tax=Nippostrongylus brasiliensis TaxID=27835 RepID=A0A0N4Y736_NIPBR|nr:unnamed protein product [Nippostrongylus brasiliensis]